jgi:2,4-dienoyl-CoA reductase-like NADH-dependent reductase (Old Yellow Enzyme family)
MSWVNLTLIFDLQRESTRKREAHFIEFSERLRGELSKTKVVLTGGFRTADGMARAIEDGACDCKLSVSAFSL